MVQHVEDPVAVARHEHDSVNNQQAGSERRHIVLVDAHLLMRLALQRVVTALTPAKVCASLGTVQEALAVLDARAGCIIVLGPSVPVSDCLTLLKQVREQQILCRVVAVQQDLQPETVRTLVEQGVHALLDEGASEQDLTQALLAASLGSIFLSRHARALLAASMTRATSSLTEREIQVLSRLKCGESNFRIARVLGLKEKTIEKYLTTIYDKLNVHSRAEAILCLHKLHF